MELNSLNFAILRRIYPLPEKKLKRDRPLQILALGLSRSGTDSLMQALVKLGFTECHHGFRFIMDSSETLPWVRIRLAKRQGRKPTASDFDTVLGDCAAVTDAPCYSFAHDLLDAYPDAKVILNYREDVDAWLQSVESTINAHDRLGWFGYFQTFFDSYLFWTHHISHPLFFSSQFDHDFAKNGRRWHTEHYRGLDERLRREGRPFLKWKVQDGWESLCEYLEKPIPTEEFPNGNTPQVFQARMMQGYVDCKKSANRNIMIAGSLAGVVVAFLTHGLLPGGGLAVPQSYPL